MPRTTPTAASACIGNSKRNVKGTPTKVKKSKAELPSILMVLQYILIKLWLMANKRTHVQYEDNFR